MRKTGYNNSFVERFNNQTQIHFNRNIMLGLCLPRANLVAAFYILDSILYTKNYIILIILLKGIHQGHGKYPELKTINLN